MRRSCLRLRMHLDLDPRTLKGYDKALDPGLIQIHGHNAGGVLGGTRGAREEEDGEKADSEVAVAVVSICHWHMD